MALVESTRSRTRPAKSAGRRMRIDYWQVLRVVAFASYLVALWCT
jgi:hypothetical protein